VQINLLNKVLIVDDDPAIIRLLEAQLSAGGYEVLSASNGREALEMVERHEPCYLITDWNMPEMNGIELCRRVRQMDLPGYVYIVFLTIRSGDDDLTAAMDAGADDFLIKPLRKDELMARLSAGARILRLESRLSQLAALDALTELPTRRTFQVLLGKEWERAHRYQLPLSAVMIDIDFFKQVNDTYGHPAGDEVIRGVVQLLRRQCRRSDIICRYGGEEFVVLLPETDESSATLWADRLRVRIAEMITPIGGADVRVTVSLGVAQMLADMEEKADLLSVVDQCLLAAKQRGRNRVESLQSLTNSGDFAPASDALAGSVLDGVVSRTAMIPLGCCAAADWTIPQVTAYLLEHRVSSVPVTDADGNLQGIISEKDILVIANSAEAPRRRVADAMRANVITYDVSAPLSRVLSCFIRSPIRSVVVTSQGKPCGMITRASIVRWFLDNRWAVRLIQRGMKPVAEIDSAVVAGGIDHVLSASGSHAAGGDSVVAVEVAAETDPTLELLVRQLVEMAQELHRHLVEDPSLADVAPLVGGAARMQDLLDELRGAASAGE
jgi:two-component system cell cycle response regulator